MCMRLVLAWCSARQKTRIRMVCPCPQVVLAPGEAGEETIHLKWGLENVIKKSSARGWGGGNCHCFNNDNAALIATQSILLPHGRCLWYTSLSHLTLQGEEAWKRKGKAWMMNDSALFLASCIAKSEQFSVGDPSPHSYSSQASQVTQW